MGFYGFRVRRDTNKFGAFMDATSKPSSLAQISPGNVFHIGRNICDTLSGVRSAAATPRQHKFHAWMSF